MLSTSVWDSYGLTIAPMIWAKASKQYIICDRPRIPINRGSSPVNDTCMPHIAVALVVLALAWEYNWKSFRRRASSTEKSKNIMDRKEDLSPPQTVSARLKRDPHTVTHMSDKQEVLRILRLDHDLQSQNSPVIAEREIR